jgi:hypothetical protein
MPTDLRRIVYKTFSDKAENLTSGDIRLVAFNPAEEFASEIYLDIVFGSTNPVYNNVVSNLSLEVNNYNKFFVKSFYIDNDQLENQPKFDPGFSFAIEGGSVYLKIEPKYIVVNGETITIEPLTGLTFKTVTVKKNIKYGDVTDPTIIEGVAPTADYKALELITFSRDKLIASSNYTNELKVDGKLVIKGNGEFGEDDVFVIEDYYDLDVDDTLWISGQTEPNPRWRQRIKAPVLQVQKLDFLAEALNFDFLKISNANPNEIPLTIENSSTSNVISLVTIDKIGNLSVLPDNATINSPKLNITNTATIEILNTTGLSNLNGGIAIDVDKFNVSDSGVLTVSSLSNLNGGIAVAIDKFTVDNTGEVYVDKDIQLNGDLYVSGGTIYCSSDTQTFSIQSSNPNPVNAILNIGSQVINTGASRTINIGANGAAGSITTVNIGSAEEAEEDSIINLYGTVNIIGEGTELTTETLSVSDNKIVLNSDATSPVSGTSGIIVNRGDEPTYGDATILWDEDIELWKTSSGLSVNNTLKINNGGGSVSFTPANSTNNITLTAPAINGTRTIATLTTNANKILHVNSSGNIAELSLANGVLKSINNVLSFGAPEITSSPDDAGTTKRAVTNIAQGSNGDIEVERGLAIKFENNVLTITLD